MNFKQGDVVERPPFFFARGAIPVWDAPDDDDAADDDGGAEDDDLSVVDELHPDDGPPLGIIVSQTCDVDEVGEPEQPWITVCPVYELPGDDEDRRYLLSKSYIYPLNGSKLPAGDWAADLRIEIPIEKGWLVDRSRVAGFASESEADAFAHLLGVRRARPALANDLVNAINRTLSKKRSNKKKAAKKIWPKLCRILLDIDEGTRLLPTAVRLHVVAWGGADDDIRKWFDAWEDGARKIAEEHQITLMATHYHDAEAMNLSVYNRCVDLGMAGADVPPITDDPSDSDADSVTVAEDAPA